MGLTRETYYAALFARLKSKVTLCKAFHRRWLTAQEVGSDQQPTLLCLEGAETARDEPGLAPVWTLEAEVVVYARTNDNKTPGTVLSNILDQIESALERQPTESGMSQRWHTTLGFTNVERVWIVGPVDKEDGALTGGQGWIHLVIQMLVVP